MSKISALLVAVLMLALAVAAGTRPLGAVAQDTATPVAVEPPQALLPTHWTEAPGQTARINGVDIYYEVYGKGNPLILLHGGLANGKYFANQIPVLAGKTLSGK